MKENKKYVLISTSRPIEKEWLFRILTNLGIDARTIDFVSPTKTRFIVDMDLFPALDRIRRYFRDEGIAQYGILFSFDASPFSWRLAEEASAYFPGAFTFPEEVIQKEISYDNYSSYQDVMELFRPILSEEGLLDAGRVYLNVGLDASLAARAFYCHRNTFNHHLDNIALFTGVDIRDFHNALLFGIYLQFKGKR